MKTQLMVMMRLVRDDGAILVMRQPGNDYPYPSLYMLPYGRPKVGEALDQAMVRELYEETNMSAQEVERQWYMDDVAEGKDGELVHYVFLFYTGKLLSGELGQAMMSLYDIELFWYEPAVIQGLPLAAPVRAYLNYLNYW